MFRSVKPTKNADPDKYKYSCYGIGFDLRSTFSVPDSSMGKNVFIFGADMSWSVHIDKKNKDDTTSTAEDEYPVNFTQSNKNFI